MMQPTLRIAIAILVASAAVCAHRISEPLTNSTARAEEPEDAIYYDEIPMEGNVSVITENPLPAEFYPSNVKKTVFGAECTIYSVAYPDQYLVMKNGYFHYYPELMKGNPKPQHGEWDWRGIWRIYHIDILDETHFQFWNHKTETFMTYNITRYNFIRGTCKENHVDTLWDINTIQDTSGTASIIQHAQHPNGFLHALTSVKKGILGQRTDCRPVGLLPYEPKKDIYHWKINCGNRKDYK